jgi:hypothetical protein
MSGAIPLLLPYAYMMWTTTTLHTEVDVIALFSGCCPLVPKIAGSLPTEAVGFFRLEKFTACLPSEGEVK